MKSLSYYQYYSWNQRKQTENSCEITKSKAILSQKYKTESDTLIDFKTFCEAIVFKVAWVFA